MKKNKYSLVAIAFLVLTIFTSCWGGSIAQTAPSEVDLFANLTPTVEDVAIFPVLVPMEIHPRTDDELYPEVFDLNPQSYELAYGKVPDCSNATFCREGWIQGFQLGIEGYNSQSFEELMTERQLELENGTKVSEEPIEMVTLQDGTEALVLPWYGYMHPSATELIFDRDSYRYVFAVVMAENQYVVDLANSAVGTN